jgi:hypothetical protein
MTEENVNWRIVLCVCFEFCSVYVMKIFLQKKHSRIRNLSIIIILIQQRVGTDYIIFRKKMFAAFASDTKEWYDKHKNILPT